jgi:hypothetical protein
MLQSIDPHISGGNVHFCASTAANPVGRLIMAATARNVRQAGREMTANDA